MGKLIYSPCPKCIGGQMFLEWNLYTQQEEWHCLQCSYTPKPTQLLDDKDEALNRTGSWRPTYNKVDRDEEAIKRLNQYFG